MTPQGDRAARVTRAAIKAAQRHAADRAAQWDNRWPDAFKMRTAVAQCLAKPEAATIWRELLRTGLQPAEAIVLLADAALQASHELARPIRKEEAEAMAKVAAAARRLQRALRECAEAVPGWRDRFDLVADERGVPFWLGMGQKPPIEPTAAVDLDRVCAWLVQRAESDTGPRLVERRRGEERELTLRTWIEQHLSWRTGQRMVGTAGALASMLAPSLPAKKDPANCYGNTAKRPQDGRQRMTAVRRGTLSGRTTDKTPASPAPD